MKNHHVFQMAFREPINIAALAAALAVSAVLLTPIPLIGALVLETAYMHFVPGSAWYDRRIVRQFQAKRRKEKPEIKALTGPTLQEYVRERLAELEEMHARASWEEVKTLDRLAGKPELDTNLDHQYQNLAAALGLTLEDTGAINAAREHHTAIARQGCGGKLARSAASSAPRIRLAQARQFRKEQRTLARWRRNMPNDIRVCATAASAIPVPLGIVIIEAETGKPKVVPFAYKYDPKQNVNAENRG